MSQTHMRVTSTRRTTTFIHRLSRVQRDVERAVAAELAPETPWQRLPTPRRG